MEMEERMKSSRVGTLQRDFGVGDLQIRSHLIDLAAASATVAAVLDAVAVARWCVWIEPSSSPKEVDPSRILCT